MIPYERYELITNLARKSEYVSIKELMEVTDSSLATLRRDIDYLSRRAKISKIRGGITYRNDDQQSESLHLYRSRERFFIREKEAIGKAAQEFICNNDIVLLTDGTTTSQVARFIDATKHLTIITNGLDVASHLRNKPNLKVILLGGVVDFTSNVITGHSVSRMLEELNPTKLIMGAGGITEEKGITCYDFLQSSFLSKVIFDVQTRIVVADHSKFDRNVLVQVADLSRVDAIVTDRDVSSKYVRIFDRLGVEYRMV